MTALICIDTATRTCRRYVSQVHAGIRRARETHQFSMDRPQTAELLPALEKIRCNVYPGMNAPPPAPEAA